MTGRDRTLYRSKTPSRLDERDVTVAEDDLAEPLFDLVTAVLAKGDDV
jgi:hypothetical protein